MMPDSNSDSDEVPDVTPEKTLFGKYELGTLIGCGAFAKVFHGRNIASNQSVAIKAVSKQKVVRGGLVANVKREISIMRRVRHSNIVKLFEVMATKNKIYFVMEFARGGELFGKVANGRFSEDLSRRYFQQLISAVGYCHARGVFHRDLKPENLLLDENWDLKVSDFGLSALNDQIRSDGLLHTLCGTPAYVAPEILTKKGYDGAKVDIWSCGIILYVLNAGYLPFNDLNVMNLYRKIYRGEFRCPKFTSPDLTRLISKLLDTNPATRITIDEILRDPWFKQGCKKIKFDASDFIDSKSYGSDEKSKSLNAFDIISLSPGYDLSGLCSDPDISVSAERFLSAESPATIRETIEDIASTENVIVTRRKNWGLKLEGQDCNFVVTVEIFRLTEKLVMVAIEKRDDKFGPCKETWKFKFKPHLSCLIYQPEVPVAGESFSVAV